MNYAPANSKSRLVGDPEVIPLSLGQTVRGI